MWNPGFVSSSGMAEKWVLEVANYGIGAVILPPVLGLGSAPTARTRSTPALMVLWYLQGGLVAALVDPLLHRRAVIGAYEEVAREYLVV